MKTVWLVLTAMVLVSTPGFCKSPAKAQSSSKQNTVKAVTVNGKLLSTDVKIVDGKTYVPVADLARLLGMSTQLDSQTGTLMLTGEAAIGAEAKGITAAKEALRALEALQSIVESGVSYRDYGSRKADAKVIVDRFLNEFPKHPAAIPIAAAMEHFADAGDFWSIYFSSDYKHDFLLVSDPQVQIYAKQYPEIESKATDIAGRRMIYLTYALNAIWNKASESIGEARSAMK